MKKSLLSLLLLAAATLVAAADKKNVLLIAGKPSHGPGEHEHNAGIQLLAAGLKQSAAGLVNVDVSLNGEWPSDERVAKADTIVIYSDGQAGHPAVTHLPQLAKKMEAGCGFVCLHYAVEPVYERAGWLSVNGKPIDPPPAGRSSTGAGAKEFKEWLGGYFEQFWSVNPHWLADFKTLPNHPVSRGVKPYASSDEWYFNLRFRDNMEGVTPILSAIAPDDTMSRKDGDHGGNPDVRKMVLEERKPQVVAWAVDRKDGGRGFGFCGGHYHAGWALDSQRTLVLNAIVWTAKADVPADGVQTKFTEDELKANLDKKAPRKVTPKPAVKK
ncbi:MAG: ThuA domain-containing protein [Verrucomicrobia bacterium]|nr:ThuA domain-containing protein [Verrucomicrobiota bacterium]